MQSQILEKLSGTAQEFEDGKQLMRNPQWRGLVLGRCVPVPHRRLQPSLHMNNRWPPGAPVAAACWWHWPESKRMCFCPPQQRQAKVRLEPRVGGVQFSSGPNPRGMGRGMQRGERRGQIVFVFWGHFLNSAFHSEVWGVNLPLTIHQE